MTILQKIWTTHTIHLAASPNASTAFSILIDVPKYYTLRVGPKFSTKASPNTQLLCFPNKEMQRIKAYQKTTKGYKNKLNKKITQTWESGKSFLFIPIDIDTLKRMWLFLFESNENLCKSTPPKPWSFSFHEAFEKMHELISDHRPVPTGRTAEIPFQKWAATCRREQRGSMPGLRGGDGTALHGSPWLQMILFLVDWKKLCSLRSEKQKYFRNLVLPQGNHF